ncbi:BREX-1 system phosphatase PglZ type A [Pelotomaculum isophthalicicum JI]|uniref:BREX-1 system phosphatase PglZ type A n=1 Tax=Pelotomaculum isophthalicicum JI TaxID=947010 RepID=A0A9X4GYF6_9FIRM|nr:BREX-1 system phosphatase PglZ type A [Pelotomaculum isophthalicicum]MDF9407775.1 BREX-1 system phosphatase PglZ type A [Pelotomaculum isophthalicicum JI]
MNLTEIKKSLERQFAREFSQGSVRNIVFWYDEEGVFAGDIDNLELEGVKIIKLYDNNMFAAKLYIEETDTAGNLLVYSPLPRPANKENWLTDTIKYSQTFSADETSLNMLNFKIDSSLRHVVARYKLFFRSSERRKRFEGYQLAPYTEAKIDLGVLSTLSKLPAPNLDHVVRTLLIELAEGETTIYDSIVKLGNIDALWTLIQRAYGYGFAEQSLEKLAIMLLVTHLSHSVNGNLPKEWQTYVSSNSNCFVFVDNFMKNTQVWNAYNKLAGFVADKLNLIERIRKWNIDDIIDCDTFEEFDHSIISRICANISLQAGEYERYRMVIRSRRNRRFYRQFETEYDTLLYACEFLELSLKHAGLPGLTMAKLFKNYIKTYYRLDGSYRHFLLSYDKLAEQDRFMPLFEKVENSYTNWYLNELSMKWCAFLDDETTWQVSGVTSQQGFYEKYVRRFVSNNERLVVIISDGLRYESAVELNAMLNGEQKGTSKLDAILGVIPSYTALGMASLLPHKSIAVTDKADIVIDGISTKGTENREKILKLVKEESVAITYENFMSLTKRQLTEKFSGVKLIYIYHNTIDARGDNAATEHEVFEATEKCFRELAGLVRALRNNISAINILITADHGYIYRRTLLAERDKTPKEDAIGIESKRRFILTKADADIQGTQVFSLNYLTKDKTDIRAIIPRVTNCYKVQGSGSCYVHGGTSLQEVVIPVIKFKSDKNLRRSMSAKKVSLSLTNLSRKITSVITHLTFFQNEPVGEKLLPLRVTAYFADEVGNRISNENIIIAESTSGNPAERTYKEKFTLKDMAYDKAKEYYLILKDEDKLVNREYARIPFVIDLVFGGSIQF